MGEGKSEATTEMSENQKSLLEKLKQYKEQNDKYMLYSRFGSYFITCFETNTSSITTSELSACIAKGFFKPEKAEDIKKFIEKILAGEDIENNTKAITALLDPQSNNSKALLKDFLSLVVGKKELLQQPRELLKTVSETLSKVKISNTSDLDVLYAMALNSSGKHNMGPIWTLQLLPKVPNQDQLAYKLLFGLDKLRLEMQENNETGVKKFNILSCNIHTVPIHIRVSKNDIKIFVFDSTIQQPLGLFQQILKISNQKAPPVKFELHHNNYPVQVSEKGCALYSLILLKAMNEMSQEEIIKSMNKGSEVKRQKNGYVIPSAQDFPNLGPKIAKYSQLNASDNQEILTSSKEQPKGFRKTDPSNPYSKKEKSRTMEEFLGESLGKIVSRTSGNVKDLNNAIYLRNGKYLSETIEKVEHDNGFAEEAESRTSFRPLVESLKINLSVLDMGSIKRTLEHIEHNNTQNLSECIVFLAISNKHKSELQTEAKTMFSNHINGISNNIDKYKDSESFAKSFLKECVIKAADLIKLTINKDGNLTPDEKKAAKDIFAKLLEFDKIENLSETIQKLKEDYYTNSQIKSIKDSGADESFKDEGKDASKNVRDLRPNQKKDEVSFKNEDCYYTNSQIKSDEQFQSEAEGVYRLVHDRSRDLQNCEVSFKNEDCYYTISQIKSDEQFQSEAEGVYRLVHDRSRDLQNCEVSFKNGNWYYKQADATPSTKAQVTSLKQVIAPPTQEL